jgi:hypothetical protein
MKLRGERHRKACKRSHGKGCQRLGIYDRHGGCGSYGGCGNGLNGSYALSLCNFQPYYYENGRGIKHTKQCGKGYLRCGYNVCTGKEVCYCA